MIYKSLSPNKGFAYNGSTYMICNNNRNEEYVLELGILDATYNRISSEGFKPINLGDMNADTMRLKYTNDRVMASWLKRHSYTEISRLYVQAVPNSFLNSSGQYSWIDQLLFNRSASWKEIEQINIHSTTKEGSDMRDADWREKKSKV